MAEQLLQYTKILFEMNLKSKNTVPKQVRKYK